MGKVHFWDGLGRGCMPRNETGIVFCRIGRTAGCGANLHEEARHEARACVRRSTSALWATRMGGLGLGWRLVGLVLAALLALRPGTLRAGRRFLLVVRLAFVASGAVAAFYPRARLFHYQSLAGRPCLL